MELVEAAMDPVSVAVLVLQCSLTLVYAESLLQGIRAAWVRSKGKEDR